VSETTIDYTDKDLIPGKTYSYVVTAVDVYGHTADSAVKKGKPTADDDIAPIAEAGIDRNGIAGKEITFSAAGSSDNHLITEYIWDFGDRSEQVTTTSPKVTHTYFLEDEDAYSETHTLTLTVYDEAGNSSSDTIEVKVYSDKYELANFTLIDKDTRSPLPNAYVYAGAEGKDVYKTDKNGSVKIVVAKGSNRFMFYKPEYLPISEDIDIDGEYTQTVKLKKEPLVTAKMEHRELSIEEAIAMGIDTEDPANQHLYTYNVQVRIDPLSANTTQVRFVINGSGDIIPTSGYVRAVQDPDAITKAETTAEKFLNVPADAVLYEGDANITIIVGGGGLDWGYTTDSGNHHTGGNFLGLINGGGSGKASIPLMALFRVSTNIAWNKEFFSVDLTIMNNADSEFVIEDSLAVLNVPEGLSLPDTSGENGTIRDMGSIAGGSSATVSWLLSGDKPGEYFPTAVFTGMLEPLGIQVAGDIKSEKPLVVDAGEAMEFKTMNTVILDDKTYQFEFMVTNVSEQDITGLHIKDIFSHYIKGIDTPGKASSRLLILPDGTELYYNDDDSWDILLPALGVEIDYDTLENLSDIITLKPGEYVIGRFIYKYYYGEIR
jgi:PKD repeat protein